MIIYIKLLLMPKDAELLLGKAKNSAFSTVPSENYLVINMEFGGCLNIRNIELRELFGDQYGIWQLLNIGHDLNIRNIQIRDTKH